MFFLTVSANGSIKMGRNKDAPTVDATGLGDIDASMVAERDRALGLADRHLLARWDESTRRWVNLLWRHAERRKRGCIVKPRHLPVEDVCAWLGDVSRSTLYVLWEEGRLPAAVKMGGRTVMDLSVLEQWVKWGRPDRSEFEARMELERREPPKRGRPRKRKGAR